MNVRSVFILILLSAGFWIHSGAGANVTDSGKTGAITLLVFQSNPCAECQAFHTSLEDLQKALPAGSLNITFYTLEDPAARAAFIQHQVSSLPEYILLDSHHLVLEDMKGMIEPDRLRWEIREALDQNERLHIPTPLSSEVKAPEATNLPQILVFSPPENPLGPQLVKTALENGAQYFGKEPLVLSLDSQKPEIRQWMLELGLSDEPAYVIVAPSGSLYRKSAENVRPWQMQADLHAYARDFKAQIQTTLAGLTSPVPVDDAIHPATMPPELPPASAAPSRP